MIKFVKNQLLIVSYRKFYSFFILILYITPIFSAYSQSGNIEVEAIIIDKETNEPLPFANIHVEGTYVGTISNEEGMFSLTVKNKYAKANVVFSFMGYDNTQKVLESFNAVGDTIFMKPTSTSLTEVKILGKNKYRELIKNAIEKFSENYPEETTYLNAYYKELTQIDGHYTKFTDAATKICYSGYTNSFNLNSSNKDFFKFNNRFSEFKKMPFPEPKELVTDIRDQVKITALRSSDNLQDYKILEQTNKLKDIRTSHLKWLENNEIGGGPLRLTGADKVKRTQDFLDPELNEHYKFTLHGKSSYNNLPVYIINFKPKDSLSKKARYYGKITIDEISKAIVSYTYKPTKISREQINQKFATQLKTPKKVEKEIKKQFITRVIELKDYEVTVNFSKIASKWFLKRIKVINNYQNHGDYLDDYDAVTESELVINNVETTEITKIPEQQTYDNSFMNPLFSYKLDYDANFWKSYNELIPTGLVGKALKDLEAKSSLEEQFNKKDD